LTLAAKISTTTSQGSRWIGEIAVLQHFRLAVLIDESCFHLDTSIIRPRPGRAVHSRSQHRFYLIANILTFILDADPARAAEVDKPRLIEELQAAHAR
jgi:hypothetical protein